MNYQDLFDSNAGKTFTRHNEETRKKISEIVSKVHKGKVNSPETRAKLTGRKRSEETKEKMRVKAREREALKRANGFAVSEETRAKISATMKLRKSA
jgi:hypothetical protein